MSDSADTRCRCISFAQAVDSFECGGGKGEAEVLPSSDRFGNQAAPERSEMASSDSFMKYRAGLLTGPLRNAIQSSVCMDN